MPATGTSPDSIQSLEFFLPRLKSGPDKNQIRVWTASGENLDFSFEIENLKKLKIEFENSENSKNSKI